MLKNETVRNQKAYTLQTVFVIVVENENSSISKTT